GTNGPLDLLPLQRRLRLLQHSDRRGPIRECRLDPRNSLCSGRRDQGPRRLLSRSRRLDRDTASGGKRASVEEKSMPTGTLTNPALAQQLLDAIDAVEGLHPGFRPAHAKGLFCSGMFTPSAEAANLTRAPHAGAPSTPVTVRYSDGTGLPTIPDNDPERSGPRGLAIRFHLAVHVHTDIVAHSANGFPVRTGDA